MEEMQIELVLAALLASAGGAVEVPQRYLLEDYTGKGISIEPNGEGDGFVMRLIDESEFVDEPTEEPSE